MNYLILFMVLITSACCCSFNGGVFDRDDRSYCLILEADISGSVEYHDKSSMQLKNYDFSISTNGSDVFGTCQFKWINRTFQFISIQFSPTNTYDDWLLVLVFGQENHENHTFKLEDYFLDANFPIGFNASENHTFYKKLSEEDKPVWSAKEKKGFSCSSALITLADRFDYKATVQFNNLRVIAFARLDSDKFHQEQDFVSCKSSLVVPIIIGILLLLTAILAIFGFFIGRRCKNAAYEQVE